MRLMLLLSGLTCSTSTCSTGAGLHPTVKYWLYWAGQIGSSVNVKQGCADKGHVCFLVQINKASVSPAVSPLRIPTCLSGLLMPKSRSLLLSPSTLILVPLSAYWWCLLRGLVAHWRRWDWISWWLSVFSTKWGIAKAADVQNLADLPRRPE